MMLIQICGLSTPETLDAAVDAGDREQNPARHDLAKRVLFVPRQSGHKPNIDT